MFRTHDGNFATKLILDLALLNRIRRLLLDDLEELLDTHPDGLLLVSWLELIGKDLREKNLKKIHGTRRVKRDGRRRASPVFCLKNERERSW